MSKKRKQYSAEHKTKVVLELLSGDQTVAQVASKYDITAKSLGDWKRQFLENASLAFDVSGATKAYKDEIYTDIFSAYGYRFMHAQLKEDSFAIGVNKVNRLMNAMDIQAIFPKKRKLTSIKNHEHKIYPYLLKELEITRPNQVWSGDITYIRTHGGFMYLAAIIDWHSRSILSWKLSNTMDTLLAIDVLKEAIDKYGTPEIFNSDQGSHVAKRNSASRRRGQYTSHEHIKVLKAHGIQISMNGKGRSIDNIAIERFFRTLKYDEIYINDYQSVSHLRNSIWSPP